MRIKRQTVDAITRPRKLNADTIPFENDLLLLAIDTQGSNIINICVFNTNSSNRILLDAQPDSLLNTPPTGEAFLGEETSDGYCTISIVQSIEVVQRSTELHFDDN